MNESLLSSPTSVAGSRLSRKASEAGIGPSVFIPSHPNLQHSGHFGASHYPITEAPTARQRPVIPNRSGSRRQRGPSMAVSVHMIGVVETDEGEQALTRPVIFNTRPPMTPPPRYALRSPETHHPPKIGDL